jgi:hypothetical protein
MPMTEREENTGNPLVKPKLSYRPSKEIIETLQITTEKSTCVGIWTEEDNVRLIRAKECFKLATWNEIQVTLFPKRTPTAIRAYYREHLKSVDDGRSISVPKTRLFGCDPLKKPLITSNETSHTSTTMKSSALQGTSTILPPESLTFDSPNISHPSSYQLSKAPKGEKRFTDTDEADSVAPAKKAKNGLALLQKKSAPAKNPAVISSKLPKSEPTRATFLDNWMQNSRKSDTPKRDFLSFSVSSLSAIEQVGSFVGARGSSYDSHNYPLVPVMTASRSMPTFGSSFGSPFSMSSISLSSLETEPSTAVSLARRSPTLMFKSEPDYDIPPPTSLASSKTEPSLAGISKGSIFESEQNNDASPPMSLASSDIEHRTSIPLIRDMSLVSESQPANETTGGKCRDLDDHKPVSMVIGISRKSTCPEKEKEGILANCDARAGKLAQFYLKRCHYSQDGRECCKPLMERVVIVASSNTDFQRSANKGIVRLRDLIRGAKRGHKVVLVCCQTDGLCTNMIGFAGFLQPFINAGIRLELMVFWSKHKFYFYDLKKLVDQFKAKMSGEPTDSYYGVFLESLARIGGNKDVMAKSRRFNVIEEGLGRRNQVPIDLDDVAPEREIKIVSRMPVARDISKSAHQDKPFQCTKCPKAFRVRSRLQVHEKLHEESPGFECDLCGHVLKTEEGLRDHQKRVCNALPEIRATCHICGNDFLAYKLARHQQKAHARSDQVDAFGKIMGVAQWTRE